MKIGILDYGAGNLRSVINAFVTIGQSATLMTQPEHFKQVDLLVLPGQGAFGDSVRQLQAGGLWEPLKEWVGAQKPYLGMCLGYQMLFESSEENPGVEGLGLFPGKVVKFKSAPGLKIPHMGWNSARFTDPGHPAWDGLGEEETFYFVHSYYPQPAEPERAACVTDYAGEFASGIAAENLFAVQFHPEKSQRAGLKLLGNALKFLGA